MPDGSTNAAWSPHTRPLRSHIHGGREQTGCRAGEGPGVSAQWGQSPVWDVGRWLHDSECARALDCALEHGWDGEFCVVCFTTTFKRVILAQKKKKVSQQNAGETPVF